jgi:hypothetical protein
MHCRVLSLFSWWSEQIDDINFFDWDCDWFWRITTLICLSVFNLFLTTFLNSRIVSSKWTFLSIAFFCIFQLSQNVEAHFRSIIKNFSTNIVLKSRKFLISIVRIRLLQFFQFVIQISIWFLNDDCFSAWNFLCICFLIWESIFLYLLIQNCNIF